MEAFKIISTLGPASLTREFLQTCQELQQTNFRLNGSHLSPPELQTYLEFVQHQLSGHHYRIYLDVQGSKMRIGKLSAPRRLANGEQVDFVPGSETSAPLLPLPHREIFATAEAGDVLVLQDGSLEMQVVRVNGQRLTAEVTKGGILRSGSGISIRNKWLAPELFIEAQKWQIEIARRYRVDFLAISYVQNGEELQHWREVCQEMDYHPRLAAKIERPEALKNMSPIIQASDEVWYCRGDLGTLLPLKELGPWQEKTLRACRQMRKPAIVAGQVFHHLTFFPDPTRSEVVHLYQIRQQGASGIVLSDETAIGENPILAVKNIQELI